MSESPESAVLVTAWPENVPGIVALSTPTKREDFAAFNRVERCLGYAGLSAEERVLAVLRDAQNPEPEEVSRKKARAITTNRVSGNTPRGELLHYFIEYSKAALEQAYAEHEAWSREHPDWQPQPGRTDKRRPDPGVDSLTQLLNRAGLDEKLDILYDWCNEEVSAGKKRLISFLLIDLDEFKTMNDRYGHDSGDELLKIVGQTIGTHIRRGDQVVGSRSGGDEFAVVFAMEVDSTEEPEDMSTWPQEDVERLRSILPEDQWRDKARLIVAQRAMGFAQRLEAVLDEVMKRYADEKWNEEAWRQDEDAQKPDPGASIGVATGDPAIERSDTVKRWADKNMYGRKLARKLVKVVAAVSFARQELVDMGAMPALSEFVDKLQDGQITSQLLKSLLRRLLELRGDVRPSVEIR